jgi:hypothetical protein
MVVNAINQGIDNHYLQQTQTGQLLSANNYNNQISKYNHRKQISLLMTNNEIIKSAEKEPNQ